MRHDLLLQRHDICHAVLRRDGLPSASPCVLRSARSPRGVESEPHFASRRLILSSPWRLAHLSRAWRRQDLIYGNTIWAAWKIWSTWRKLTLDETDEFVQYSAARQTSVTAAMDLYLIYISIQNRLLNLLFYLNSLICFNLFHLKLL